MKYFPLSAILFALSLLSFPVPRVFADVISPAILFYEVDPGESFEFDLVFSSTEGGDYDVLVRTLRFNESGGKVYEDAFDDVLTLTSDLVHFEPLEQRHLPVVVNIPPEVVSGDLNYVIGLRKRTNSFQTFELSTVVALSVGERALPKGLLESSEFRFDEEDPSLLKGVNYRFQNLSGRVFAAVPELEFLNQQGEVLYLLKGERRIHFPSSREPFVYLFKPQKEILIGADVDKALFRVVMSDAVRLEQELDVGFQSRILPVEAADVPLDLRYRERRRFSFLYNPIFTRFAILIGLTLVAGSFLIGRKGS